MWGIQRCCGCLFGFAGVRSVRRATITPPLSLVISAYNEASVLRRKLDNAVSLEYPRDRLEIVVVSDASDDGTDAIVAEYAARGVRLARQAERRGKTAGLNRTVPSLKGEIVAFSDANAMYEREALLKLVRNFADDNVGCVTGEARYLDDGMSVADIGERAYWNYEIQIKRYETALGSMVGGDGAIYAIRRTLWRELPEDAINDFLNPLQIVVAGWRAVYEPEAVCYEDTAGGMRTEYRRRVRIVSRSWRAVFQAPGVLNPFRVGVFTWSLVSHKMLRWLSGGIGVLAAIGAVNAVARGFERQPVSVLLVMIGVGVAAAVTPAGRRLARLLLYFAVINAASLVGVLKGSLGKVSGVWAPPRQGPAVPRAASRVQIPVGRLLQLLGLMTIIATAVAYVRLPTEELATVLFWCSGGLLAYVYLGYPALLGAIRLFAGQPVRRHSIEPRVCLLTAANDEAGVIEAKLRNSLALDYPADRLEIVVASDGSVDDTNTIVRRFAPRVKLLEFFPRRGKIATISDAIRGISSEIVVFSDANTFLDRDAIRALVQNFADDHVGGVSGDVVLLGERAALGRAEDLYYRYERWIQHAESEIGSMIGADGALYAIRRELFVAPPGDTILDDMAIPMAVIRAGRRVVYEGAARAEEEGSETAREEFARKTRVVAGAMQFIKRADSSVPVIVPQVMLSLISHKALRWLSPAFGTCAFVSSVALAGASYAYAAAALGMVILLTLGVAGCAPALRRVSIIAIAHYFCLIQAAAAVGFVRGLAGRQSVLWRRFERAPIGLT